MALPIVLLSAALAGCDQGGGANLSARADEAPERFEAARQEAAEADRLAREAEAARTRGKLQGIEDR